MMLSQIDDMIQKRVKEEYEIASEARKKGYDPEDKVDVILTKDVAERVVWLVSSVYPDIVGKGIEDRIRELEEKYGFGDWRVALVVAGEVAKQKFCKFDSVEKALEAGVRIGVAYITMGVTAAPLEGFVELKLKQRQDGGNYVSCFFAGPIRSAGGTAAAISVLIADYVRRQLNISTYDPTEKEINRYIIEIEDYHRAITRLQYYPSKEEIKFLIQHIPVEVNGDATSDREVSNYKDLPRVETNRIRGGMCLVVAEGLASKARKIVKFIESHGKETGLEDWLFLRDFLDIQTKEHTTKNNKSDHIAPKYVYLEETVAGRPIFSYPMARGGFRLRYGRSRLSGLAAAGLHPLTMRVLEGFIATGTQLKVERPGKAAAITPCDYISPPVVLLNNGEVTIVSDETEYNRVKDKIKEILFLGDILFNYGDFLENNHVLIPSPYVEEWWVYDLADADNIDVVFPEYKDYVSNPWRDISEEQAVKLSKKLNIPLHPKYTHFYSDLEPEQARKLITYVREYYDNGLPFDQEIKRLLELACVPHYLDNNKIIIKDGFRVSFEESFGIGNDKILCGNSTMELFNSISNVKLMPKSTVYIGARMGRPEKAKPRKMKGTPHVLFPVGREGGRLRSVNEAAKLKVLAEFPTCWCPKCNRETIWRVCEVCGSRTERRFFCPKCKVESRSEIHSCGTKCLPYKKRRVDIKHYLDLAMENLGISGEVFIKGVRGTSNKDRTPERLEKGVLRALHNVYVNKDGTIRYDAIEVPVTHFKPSEIGTPVDKLRDLGYTEDIFGKPLVSDDQILQLHPQDVILPGCKDWPESDSSEMLINVAKYVDDLLVRFYKMEPYYNIQSRDDLIGHLVIVLAPHTSSGTVGRIIGFSNTQGFFAHPFMHAAVRRNCDGDEVAFMLLLEALIDFSRSYLPDVRGGRVMDAPIVLSSSIITSEIDTEAFNMDIVERYPKEFYLATQEWKKPYEVDIDIVKHHVKQKHFKIRFTTPTTSMNAGVNVSMYKRIEDMLSKIELEMDLAEKIRAVDANDVATLIIDKHFLKDIKGNLRKYSKQTFRCVNCNTIYRRIPLSGRCNVCGGKLVLTISEGSVVKYLKHSLKLAEKYDVPEYLLQTIHMLEKRVESLFGKEPTEQKSIFSFLNKSKS